MSTGIAVVVMGKFSKVIGSDRECRKAQRESESPAPTVMMHCSNA